MQILKENLKTDTNFEIIKNNTEDCRTVSQKCAQKFHLFINNNFLIIYADTLAE